MSYPVAYKWQAVRSPMRDMVQRAQEVLSSLPQYEPETEHYFHAGMYVRKVTRPADIWTVGRVHKKEHLYIVASGNLLITDGLGTAKEYGPGDVIKSEPGTKRSVYSVTPAVTMTIHKTRATTPEQAFAELMEDDPDALFDASNKVKPGVLKYKTSEVLS